MCRGCACKCWIEATVFPGRMPRYAAHQVATVNGTATPPTAPAAKANSSGHDKKRAPSQNELRRLKINRNM